jgi:hypothetical protein
VDVERLFARQYGRSLSVGAHSHSAVVARPSKAIAFVGELRLSFAPGIQSSVLECAILECGGNPAERERRRFGFSNWKSDLKGGIAEAKEWLILSKAPAMVNKERPVGPTDTMAGYPARSLDHGYSRSLDSSHRSSKAPPQAAHSKMVRFEFQAIACCEFFRSVYST